MRIMLDDPGKSASLRDYFSRLGAVVVHAADGMLEVMFPDGLLGEGESPQAYLERWTRANGAVTQAAAAASAPAAPAQAAADVFDLASVLGATRPPKRLGDLLVSKGLVDADQLAEALVESRQKGDLLGRVLLRRGFVFEEELARTLAEQWGLPFVSLYRIGVDARAVRLVPPDIGLRYAAIPVRFVEGVPQVAFADPSDPEAIEAIAGYVPGLTAAVSELSDIEAAWRLLAA
jgi:hypothetical protein